LFGEGGRGIRPVKRKEGKTVLASLCGYVPSLARKKPLQNLARQMCLGEKPEKVGANHYCSFFGLQELIETLLYHPRRPSLNLRAMECCALSPHSTG